MTHRFPYYVVFLLIGLLSLINRDLTPVNELKYISIALESIQAHHWFTFYNHGEIYADKPPAYFWLLMAAIKLFGVQGGIIMTGSLSLISAIGICEIMYRWTAKQLTPALRISAILVLLSSTLFVGASIILRMDMLMAFFITLALYSFYQACHRLAAQQNLDFYPHSMLLAILMATLIKGPVGLMLPILVCIVFLIHKKSLSQLRYFFPWKMVIASFAILALWLLVVYWEGGSTYLYALTLGQAAKRGINASVHAEPIYYYLETALLMLQPWSLLCLLAVAGVIKQKAFSNEQQRFFAIVVLTGLVMLSLVSSKLEIYFLPLVPFCLYFCLLQISHTEKSGLWKWAILPISALLIALPVALIFTQAALSKLPVDRIDVYLVTTILWITGVLCGYFALRQKIPHALNSLALGALAILLTAAIQIPKYNHLLGMKELATLAQSKAKQDPVTTGQAPTGYYTFQYSTAQNMNVYLGQPVTPINTEQALLNLPKGSIVFSKRSTEQLEHIFKQHHQTYQSLERVGKYDLLIR